MIFWGGRKNGVSGTRQLFLSCLCLYIPKFISLLPVSLKTPKLKHINTIFYLDPKLKLIMLATK